MLCKILHGLVHDLITLDPLSTSTCGHSQDFVILELIHSYIIIIYLYSFLPSTINLWNSLPDSLVDLDEINQFKEDLSKYLFPTD